MHSPMLGSVRAEARRWCPCREPFTAERNLKAPHRRRNRAMEKRDIRAQIDEGLADWRKGRP